MSREVGVGVMAAARFVGVSIVHRSEVGAVVALDAVDLAVPAHALTAVVGPSGSGKSSLLRVLACVDRPSSGEVWIGDERVDQLGTRARRRVRRHRVGYLFQRPGDNLLPYLTVAEHVSMAARLRGAHDVDVDSLLEVVGLAGRHRHRPAELSGGEQQRAAVAAAIAGGPAFVVADEPTAALDSANSLALLDLFATLAARGTTLVVASHDEAAISRADVVLRLADGKLV